MPHDSVDRLQRMMIDGGEKAFDIVPLTLANVIKERLWAEQTDKDGVPFKSFEAFVTHKLWWGLESTIDDLKAYCRKKPDVRRLIDEATDPLTGHGGTREQGDNITLNTGDRGTSATYTLKRLKRDRPDLAGRVISGELSANAAALEAGFRKTSTPLAVLRREWKRASVEERRSFLAEVTS